jgi:hypothetical protein
LKSFVLKNISCGLLAKARPDKFIRYFSINAASGIPETQLSEARAVELVGLDESSGAEISGLQTRRN